MSEEEVNRRPMIGAIRRALFRLASGGSVSLGMLVLLATTTILILQAPVRTVSLQAHTLSAEIELTGEPMAWDLTGATVCQPSTDLRAPPQPPCDPGQIPGETLDEPVDWQGAQHLSVKWQNGFVRIALLTDHARWPRGTVLQLSQRDFHRNGAIAFIGYLVVGNEIGPGGTTYVLDGRYAFFEPGLVGGWFGWSADITREGDIRRGDRLRILCQQNISDSCSGREVANRPGFFLNPVAGTITPGLTGEDGLAIGAYGEESNSLLEVAYFGIGDTALLIKPNWIERAKASSSLLALSLLFSLLAPLLLPLLERVRQKRT